jgi:hypothetical protein
VRGATGVVWHLLLTQSPLLPRRMIPMHLDYLVLHASAHMQSSRLFKQCTVCRTHASHT